MVLDFLIEQGLVALEKGRFQMGPQSTHIGAGENLVSRHWSRNRELKSFYCRNLRNHHGNEKGRVQPRAIVDGLRFRCSVPRKSTGLVPPIPTA